MFSIYCLRESLSEMNISVFIKMGLAAVMTKKNPQCGSEEMAALCDRAEKSPLPEVRCKTI